MRPRAHRSIRPVRTGVACAIAVVMTMGASSFPAVPAGAQSDDVDVLTATREEVRVAVEALADQLGEQQAVLDAARAAAAAAAEAAERAEARVELARHEVVQAEEAVRRYALEAYIRPPAEDAVRVLSMANADDAGYAKNVLKIMATKRYEVVETLIEKRSVAEQERAAADEVAAASDAASAEAQSRLGDLEQTLAQQRDLAASLDDRLDAALAEAAALEELDRQMADELAAQEVALRAAAPPTAAAQPGAQVTTPAPRPSRAAPAPVATTPPAGSGGSTGATPTAPAPTTPAPTPSPPSGVVTRADVTSVGGILVHNSIATNTRNLLNAANAAGISLGGSGWRDTARQVELRRAHCGPTYYDIYQKPSSQCSPPTAIPGRSMHERGLALDLTHNGALIRSRTSPAFQWLAANAARFGFYNLPSEPWHWSTNGN